MTEHNFVRLARTFVLDRYDNEDTRRARLYDLATWAKWSVVNDKPLDGFRDGATLDEYATWLSATRAPSTVTRHVSTLNRFEQFMAARDSNEGRLSGH